MAQAKNLYDYAEYMREYGEGEDGGGDEISDDYSSGDDSINDLAPETNEFGDDDYAMVKNRDDESDEDDPNAEHEEGEEGESDEGEEEQDGEGEGGEQQENGRQGGGQQQQSGAQQQGGGQQKRPKPPDPTARQFINSWKKLVKSSKSEVRKKCEQINKPARNIIAKFFIVPTLGISWLIKGLFRDPIGLIINLLKFSSFGLLEKVVSKFMPVIKPFTREIQKIEPNAFGNMPKAA